MKYTKHDHEEYLNECGVPWDDCRSNNGRIPDNAKYGAWIRKNDPVAFNVGYNERLSNLAYEERGKRYNG